MIRTRPAGAGRLLRKAGLRTLVLGSIAGCQPDGPPESQTFGSASRAATSLRANVLEWSPARAESFPPGVRIAVLQGNPDVAGPFTLRAAFPDGYRFPAHRHAMDQQITVISGTFLFAQGERFDFVRLRAHEAGDFLIAPAGLAHYGEAEGETIVQLHGIGPFATEVLDPFLPDTSR